MSPIVDSLTQNLINEWHDYFDYWSAAHGSDNHSEYRAFTYGEIAQAQVICNRLQQLDDCFSGESCEYSRMLGQFGEMMR